MNASLLNMEFKKSLNIWPTALFILLLLSISSYQMMHNFIYSGILTGVFVFLNNLAMDKKNNTYSFVNTLPVTRKQFISAKYCSTIVFILAGIGLGLITTALLPLIGFDVDVNIFTILLVSSLGFIIISVNIPVYLLMKDKESMVSIIIIIALIIGGLSLIQKDFLIGQLGITTVSSANILGVAALSVSAVMMVISYFISCAFFIKRDLS
ncbi:ABC-2 transporter permease [Paenibacillus marinisediminis]